MYDDIRTLVAEIRTPRGEISIYKVRGLRDYIYVAHTDEAAVDAVDLSLLERKRGQTYINRKLHIEELL